MKRLFFLVFFLCSGHFYSYAQDINLSVLSIPDSLKENANAVIRSEEIVVQIKSVNNFEKVTNKIITVLNEAGLSLVDANEYYDKSTSVSEMEAVVYDALGNELKKIKRKDFKDNAISQGAIVTDGRMLFLDFTPTQYPFTIKYKSVVESSNTAFLPKWIPVSGFHCSIQKASFLLVNNSGINVRFKERNFNGLVKNQSRNNTFFYTISNCKAIKNEDLSPSLLKLSPSIFFAMDEFELEGVKGFANSWSSFGKWIFDNFLKGADELDEKEKIAVKDLVGQETDPMRKAKIIYEYVQKKTRYVSIQLGIGGWRPMQAKDVSRLGYGDCKALTNYTKALLKEVGVPSYYTIVYGNDEITDLEEDFVSLQGNHAILGVPNKDTIEWLECTSQIQPFAFQGDFTDNRKVLIVDSDKAQIVKTKIFTSNDNVKYTKSHISLDGTGMLKADVLIDSKGLIYNDRFHLNFKSKDELNKFYMREFSNLNRLKIDKIDLTDNKEAINLKERIVLYADNQITLSGITFITVNPVNQLLYLPGKFRFRKNPFEIQRDRKYVDEIEYNIPEGYVIENIPAKSEFDTEFGTYKANYIKKSNNSFLMTREVVFKSGYFAKEKYEEYRKFRENIAKAEALKFTIVKNN